MANIVEVSFKGNRRDYFVLEGGDVAPDEHVIVEADRGEDLGRVTAYGAVAERKCSGSSGCATPMPPARVVRKASGDDVDRWRTLRADEDRVRRTTREKVQRHGLKMKVTEAEWQFDRKKLTIYFTADRRVDFRELVRDLARTFRTRIELKQIGVRDEAALLGGVGRCGRELCCSTWLREIKPVSLQLAKDQRLSLNPAQISGCCGRLMCCLTYEHQAYVEARKRFPREGKTIRTGSGEEKVVGVDIWRECVTLRDREGNRRTVELAELKKEVRSGGLRPREGGREGGSAANGDPASNGPGRGADGRGDTRGNGRTDR